MLNEGAQKWNSNSDLSVTKAWAELASGPLGPQFFPVCALAYNPKALDDVTFSEVDGDIFMTYKECKGAGDRDQPRHTGQGPPAGLETPRAW